MTISLILLEIDVEVAKLQQARVILSGVGTKRKPGRPAVGSTESPATSFNQEECGGVQTKRRKMSTETRKKWRMRNDCVGLTQGRLRNINDQSVSK